MQTKDVIVIIEQGLHAKPADMFVRAANKFTSDISIKNLTKDSQFENAKSILKVLALGIYRNHKVRLQTEGIDEIQAVNDLAQLLSTNISEEGGQENN